MAWKKGDRVYLTSKAGNVMAGVIESDIEEEEHTQEMRNDPTRNVTFIRKYADILVVLPETDDKPATSFTSERRNLAFVTRRDELIEGVDVIEGKSLSLDQLRVHALNLRTSRSQAVSADIEAVLAD